MTDTGHPLFLFVRPPRPLWPFNGPGSAFWPPLAFASLAGMLRRCAPEWRVAILDAPVMEMGWRSLEAELRARKPAVVAMGEEAVSCVECLRLARLARRSGAKVVAGGCFFGHVAPQVLGTGLVDVVVHGEGEETIAELARALRAGTADALAQVAGLSFVREGAVVRTPARPLLADLDDLPMPTWDLLPMARYGAASRNHPALASIESSRGCTDACAFCVLWRQMGVEAGGQTSPRLRVKSVARLMEEIRVLTRGFGRRYLGWVDPCFNAHPRLAAELAEALLRADIHLGQSAWLRADGLVRDARAGALAPQVRAGLNEVYVGVERTDDAGLAEVCKRLDMATVREAFGLLAREHPQVFTVGTFLYGLPGDGPATMRRIFRLSCELGMDHAFFIPLTPLPGTPLWRDEMWDDAGARMRDFGFLPCPAGMHARRDLDRELLIAIVTQWPAARWRRGWRDLCGHGRKRRVAWRLASRSAWFAADAMLGRGFLTGRRGGMVFPRWYEE